MDQTEFAHMEVATWELEKESERLRANFYALLREEAIVKATVESICKHEDAYYKSFEANDTAGQIRHDEQKEKLIEILEEFDISLDDKGDGTVEVLQKTKGKQQLLFTFHKTQEPG